jgi:type VI protein secretion system component Hcp
MSTHYFLKIGLRLNNTIIGASRSLDFPGWIEIESWVPMMPNHPITSGGPGKTRVEGFGFTKLSDGASQRLFTAWDSAEYFDGAVLAVLGPNAPYWFQFTDVWIASFQSGFMSPSTKGLADQFVLGFAGLQQTPGTISAARLFGLTAMKTLRPALTAAALATAASLAPISAPVVAGALRRR